MQGFKVTNARLPILYANWFSLMITFLHKDSKMWWKRNKVWSELFNWNVWLCEILLERAVRERLWCSVYFCRISGSFNKGSQNSGLYLWSLQGCAIHLFSLVQNPVCFHADFIIWLNLACILVFHIYQRWFLLPFRSWNCDIGLVPNTTNTTQKGVSIL